MKRKTITQSTPEQKDEDATSITSVKKEKKHSDSIYMRMTVAQLKSELTNLGLPRNGNKATLQVRLLQALSVSSLSTQDENTATVVPIKSTKSNTQTPHSVVKRMKVTDLKKALRARGLSASGSKDTLVARLGGVDDDDTSTTTTTKSSKTKNSANKTKDTGDARTKGKKPPVLAGLNFVLSTVYKGKRKSAMQKKITVHGGLVEENLSSNVDFLIQSHNGDCDDRLEECCEFDVVAVPFAYVEYCITQRAVHPFRLWAMVGGDPGPCFNPSLDHTLGRRAVEGCGGDDDGRVCLLGTTDFGNVDYRARETEEVNQSVHDYIEQKWTKPNDCEGRSVIYILPMTTTKANKKTKTPKGAYGFPSFVPADVESLQACTAFLEAYFHCTVKSLPPTPLKLTKSKAHVLGQEVAIEYSVVEGRKAPLLSVLDLLDAAELALPEDGYCVLGLTDQNIYEGDDLDGTMRGRAFGGSRIAVFSTAHYHRALVSQCGKNKIQQDFAYQLATLAHETMHCFGLDHCGLYACCMNSWSDEIREFSLLPLPEDMSHSWEGNVINTLHVCPVCVRKLQVTCGFNLPVRYRKLRGVYRQLGLDDQERWCDEVLRVYSSTSSV